MSILYNATTLKVLRNALRKVYKDTAGFHKPAVSKTHVSFM